MDVGRRAVLGLLAGTAAGALGGCARSPGPGVVELERYGPDPSQVAELRLPTAVRPTAVRGVVVLLHGGYWRAGPDRHQLDAVAGDLVARGWATWNVEYRRTGAGGGWPTTFADVAAALDRLADVARRHALPLTSVPVVGHSAGGTLALWLAARHRLPARADATVGPRPRVRVTAAASLAGVDALTTAWTRWRLGGDAIPLLLGGPPPQVPSHVALADPARLLPVGVPLLVAHGRADRVVPPQLSAEFAAAARAAGDRVRLDLLPATDHGAFLQPGSAAWRAVRDWLGTEPPT